MSSPKTKILFVGFGKVNTMVLDMMMRQNGNFDFVVAGRDLQTINTRANLSKLVGAQFGCYHNLETEQLDLNSIDQTAAVLNKHKPDIVFNGTSLQSWWVINELPADILTKLNKAHTGPWLPMHLTLSAKLMRGVKESGLKPFVVNASFPDFTNPVLTKNGMGPDIGIGNVANVVAGTQAAAAAYLQVPVERVSIRLFLHHYLSHHLSRHGETGTAPYHFSTYLDGQDVSDKVDDAAVFKMVSTRFKRSGGVEGVPMTASSAVRALNAIEAQDGTVFHAPGPLGLPGGYAVKVTAGRKIEIALPQDLTLAQAVQINNDGQRFDGVERIEEDGTVVFEEGAMAIMKDVLGYSPKSMRLEESEDLALELSQRYKALLKRVGSGSLVVA